MNDLIRRHEAINRIINCADAFDNDEVRRGFNLAVGILYDLPAAKSEQPVSYELYKKMLPSKVKINLNEYIKVKLTDLGKEIYYHQYDDLNKVLGKTICTPLPPKVDENGYSIFQLWDFIELYGSYIGMCKPNVIEPLEIVYEVEG